MYEMTERDGAKNSLVSSISVEDFKAHKDFLVGYSDEELTVIHKSATSKECIKNEDGTWSASFSGYSEESVLALIDYAFDSTVLMLDGYKVKDVIFTIEANSDFLPTDWEYEIVFEKTSGDYPEPEAKTEIEFDNIGTAKAPEIDLSAYTEVEGLVELQKLRAALGEYLTSEKAGGFKAESKQSVNSGTSMNSTHETDTVTYEVKNGKYIFDIDATVKGIAKSLNSSSQSYGFQSKTVLEGIAFYGFQIWCGGKYLQSRPLKCTGFDAIEFAPGGKGQGLQFGAFVKGTAADVFHIFSDIDLCQPGQGGKGIGGDIRNLITNDYGGDALGAAFPWDWPVTECKIGEYGQNAVRGQPAIRIVPCIRRCMGSGVSIRYFSGRYSRLTGWVPVRRFHRLCFCGDCLFRYGGCRTLHRWNGFRQRRL
jgi:hypothetical protein